uniref:tRNA-uridine aminocarboxypropyltransferase n=1 Tax=Oryza rufipogon TaxID=4529 RepID=A0A0E0R439_ORYRU
MDFEPLPSAAGDATADETPPGRAVCSSGCGRPSTVCLCPYLPATPLPTSTTVVVLHHPHALRRNPLSTLPLLARSLSNLRLIPGRRLLPSSGPLIPNPVLLLFPSPGAADLASWCRSTPPAARANPTLLLLDGTWKQAKEMHAASLPFLSSFAVPVSLPVDCGVDGDSIAIHPDNSSQPPTNPNTFSCPPLLPPPRHPSIASHAHPRSDHPVTLSYARRRTPRRRPGRR